MSEPSLSELWRDSGHLTPPEKWTDSARGLVLLGWHGEHPGEYLSHDEAQRVLAAAYLKPMPTITLEQILSNL